jgi:multidrug efflux pump subunit AcrA (membrane-fusion protein)
VDRLLVESSISEADVHRVKAGQIAKVRLEAFPDLRLSGRVMRVGTLASTSIERPFEEKRFDLIIEIDGSHPDLRPEMTARADITVAQRDHVLQIPVTAVTEEGASFVAHVAGSGGTSRRELQLGESNGDVVQVIAGLEEGERVLLGSPALSTPASASAPGAADAR